MTESGSGAVATGRELSRGWSSDAAAESRRRISPYDLLAAAYLCVLLGFCARDMWSSLFRPWFFSSDEWVVVAEIIRFVQFDFRQHFFDMPGTPMMFVAALGWFVVYVVAALRGAPTAPGGVGEFTFKHLPELFAFTRGMTLFLFVLSIVLLFWVTAKVVNRSAAYVASLMLAASPIYSSASSFVRVESMSMCCMLGAILCLVYDIEHGRSAAAEPSRQDRGFLDLPFWAGVLAGVGAGARLHSITASLPVLVLMLWTSSPTAVASDYPKWVKRAAAVPAVLVAAFALLVFLPRSPLATLPHARGLMLGAWLAAIVGLLACVALYAAPAARRLLMRAIDPPMVRLAIGTGVGLVVGMPTVITQYQHLLNSMEMYSGSYRDLARAGMPFLEHLRWYITYYLNVFAPDRVLQMLLGLGLVCIVVRRDRRVLPLAAGIVTFFLSKPMSLLPAQHHVILWVPFYAIVCAYPVGLVAEWLRATMRHGRQVAAVAVAALLAFVGSSITWGPGVVSRATGQDNDRLENVISATDWIKHNTEAGATVAVSYYCFNPEIFFTWIRMLEVPVPALILDGRDYITWWGNRSTLEGKAGYACAARGDLPLMKTRNDEVTPGDGTDPFTDPRFRTVQTFGNGDNMVALFHFNYLRLAPGREDTAPTKATAVFVGTDTATQGSWVARYGQSGYVVAADATSFPNYAQFTQVSEGGTAFTWQAATSDSRALQHATGAGRAAGGWYSFGRITIDLDLTDGAPHQVALYGVDWDAMAREERVDVLDAITGTVLDTRRLSGFTGGQYLVWTVRGHVSLVVTRTSGLNAVVSGLFLDPTVPQRRGAPAK